MDKFLNPILYIYLFIFLIENRISKFLLIKILGNHKIDYPVYYLNFSRLFYTTLRILYNLDLRKLAFS